MKKVFLIYKRCGVFIGSYRIVKSVFFHTFSTFYTMFLRFAGAEIGRSSLVQYGVKVAKPKDLIMGENCLVCEGVSIVSELNEGAKLELKDNVQINCDVTIDYAGGIVMKSGVLISEQTVVYTHSHGYDPRSIPTATPLIIEKDTWIGSKAIILPSVCKIEEGSIVAAGSVLSKNTSRNSIFAGNPARYIKNKS